MAVSKMLKYHLLLMRIKYVLSYALFYFLLNIWCINADASIVPEDVLNSKETNETDDSKIIPLETYCGMSDSELGDKVWVMCGRADKLQSLSGLYFEDNIYSESLGARRDFFMLKKDSLYWTGYTRGKNLGMVIEPPVLFTFIPKMLLTRDKKDDISYKAKGKLNVNTPLSVSGQCRYAEIQRGKAIISAGDTLENVVLTKQIDTCYVQSELTHTIDTASRVIYRWFYDNRVVPIALQCDGILYIPATLNCDLVNNDSNDNTDKYIQIIEDAIFRAEGKTVSVILSEPLPLKIYIMDVTGNIYVSKQGNASRFDMDVKGLNHNDYIISIVSPYSEYTRKILFTL